ncbi:MAG: hypothetical protein WDM78_02965 [Puia sp.]
MLFVPAGFPFNVHWKDGFKPPFAKVALNVAVVPEQISEACVWMLIEGVTAAPTVMATGLEVAEGCRAQSALLINLQTMLETPKPGVVVNEGPLTLASVPFTCQEYNGAVPSLDGTAINVTGMPAHACDAEARTETAGLTFGFTIIVFVLNTQPPLVVTSAV